MIRNRARPKKSEPRTPLEAKFRPKSNLGFRENGEEENCTASDSDPAIKIQTNSRGFAAGANAREILSTETALLPPKLSEAINCQNQIWGFALAKSESRAKNRDSPRF
jgi:hypothetical protein